jgi:stage II sporulation protein M
MDMNRKSRFSKLISEHFRENVQLYIFIVILLFVGIIFGAIIVNSLGFVQKEELFFYLERFFGQVTNDKIANSKEMFLVTYFNYLKTIGFMWVLGISIIGMPIIIIFLFLKGIMVGFTVGFLVNQFGIEGFLISLSTIMPQNLIVLPAFILITVLGTNISLQMLRNQFTVRKQGNFGQNLLKYVFSFILVAIILTIPAVYEAFVSPVLMKQVLLNQQLK